MSAQSLNVNIDVLLKSSRRIEFWHNNGDGTCTRLVDGLSLTLEQYDRLPGERELLAWADEVDGRSGELYH